MAMTVLSFSLLVLLMISFSWVEAYNSVDAYVYGGCSDVKYTPGASYSKNLDAMLTSLVSSATFFSYKSFTIGSDSPQDVIYGLYQCRGDISMPDCATCVAKAVSNVPSLCPLAAGGIIQMEGCYLKFDNSTFLGMQDKSVVLKKCGPVDSNDYQFKNRRDGVLDGLLSSRELYRASGSDELESVAQCVGDLKASQCQECVAQAVAKMKQECFMAGYGDMYLGKCYVRYTSNKSHAASGKGHGFTSSFSSSEKTIAVIVGLLAAVVLLIIFLMWLRNTFTGRHGK